jgi:hypothetical protein
MCRLTSLARSGPVDRHHYHFTVPMPDLPTPHVREDLHIQAPVSEATMEALLIRVPPDVAPRDATVSELPASRKERTAWAANLKESSLLDASRGHKRLVRSIEGACRCIRCSMVGLVAALG